ncbi:alpha tubulin suppressor [Tilletia horrida]|nr:alpha tubulin suppressor [Tilletia horrida]
MATSFTLLTAGSNARGQLGIGHDEDARAWTLARCDTLEHNEVPPSSSSALPSSAFPPPGHRVLDLAGGANHTVAVLEDAVSGERTLWGAGDASGGQLGPDLHAEGEAFVRFRRVRFLPLARATDGHCEDAQPEPEAGPQVQEEAPRLELVAAGWEATYVVLSGRKRKADEEDEEDDALFALGTVNDFGQLGVGATPGQIASGGGVHQVLLRQALLDAADRGELGLHSAGQVGRIRVVRLAAGVRHACAVVELGLVQPAIDGQPAQRVTILLGWGAARHGQLARNDSDTTTRQTVKPERAYLTPRVMACWPGRREVQIQCGRDHTVVQVCGMQADGADEMKVITLGSDRQGQCPFPPHATTPAEHTTTASIAAMWNTTLVLSRLPVGDRVLVWGASSKGQSGTGNVSASTVAGHSVDTLEMLSLPGHERISSLVAGSEHALVVLKVDPSRSTQEEDEVWGWGWTEHGNLPLGNSSDSRRGGDVDESQQVIGTPLRIWPPSAPDIPPGDNLPEARAQHHSVDAVWAGCATTFLQLRLSGPLQQ